MTPASAFTIGGSGASSSSARSQLDFFGSSGTFFGSSGGFVSWASAAGARTTSMAATWEDRMGSANLLGRAARCQDPQADRHQGSFGDEAGLDVEDRRGDGGCPGRLLEAEAEVAVEVGPALGLERAEDPARRRE